MNTYKKPELGDTCYVGGNTVDEYEIVGITLTGNYILMSKKGHSREVKEEYLIYYKDK